MKRFFKFLCISIAVGSVLPYLGMTAQAAVDSTAPYAISDVKVTNVTQKAADVTFTTPSDNGTLGMPSSFDLRYAPTAITADGFATATKASGLPVPMQPGRQETYTLVGLDPGTLYAVAIKSKDEAGSVSDISNIVTFTTTGKASDTTAPVVEFTSPVVGTTLSGSVTVTASSTDPAAPDQITSGMGGVQLKIDGANVGTELTSTPYSATWDTTTATNGSHIISAVARDAAGNITTFAGITVTVNNVGMTAPDTAPPSFLIMLPVTGATVGNNATITPDVSDPALPNQKTSGIASVQYKVDGVPLGTVNASPYSYVWDTTLFANGTHTIFGQAADVDGNLSPEFTTIVTVSNTTTPPTISETLSANLVTSVTSGKSPLTGVTLTATPSGTAKGYVDYYFYCNRKDSDTTTTIEPDAKFTGDLNTIKTVNGLCRYDTAGIYTAKVIMKRGSAPAAEARVSIAVSSNTSGITSSVVLSAAPSSGVAPVSSVNLTAVPSGTATGPANFYFYCNRPDTSTSTSTPADMRVLNDASPIKTASGLCSYSAPGVYTAKVIVERNGAPATEARFSIPVSGAQVAGSAPQIQGFTATGSDGQVRLRWLKPSDGDTVRTIISRSQNGTPALPVYGTIVYEGTGDSFVDTSLTNGSLYYYAAFPITRSGKTATGVGVSVTPSVEGQQGTAAAPVPAVTGVVAMPQYRPDHSTPSQVSATSLRLINASGTIYIVSEGYRRGITNPGMLATYGLAFADAKAATPDDLALPEGGLVLPQDGALVKSKEDQTVYLISSGQRYGFVSSKVFTSLGYKFSSVLVVTNPELQALPRAENLSDGAAAHRDGADVNDRGTMYWIGGGQRHAYPSTAVYNSWHVKNDYSRVVPANAADRALPVGDPVPMRVKG